MQSQDVDRETDRGAWRAESPDEEVVSPAGGDQADVGVERLEDDAGVVGERGHEPDVRDAPARRPPRVSLARQVDDRSDLRGLVGHEPLDLASGDIECSSSPLEVVVRHAAGARPRPRADVIPESQELEHMVTDRAGETADEPTHEPDVPDMDRGPVRPEAAGLERFGEEREDVGVGDGARGADELDAGLEQLALAGGHRGLLAEDRSEIRQPQRAVHLAVSLRDEPSDGRGEVGSQRDELAVGVEELDAPLP